MKDKYTATWVSYSSISAFMQCPRSYYLRNVYRHPKSGKKIKVMGPALALGQAVHEVLEELAGLETKKRFNTSLIERFDDAWEKVSGQRGGFSTVDQERKIKARGQEMLRMVMSNPGPLQNLAVKIQKDLPYYWLSEEDNIILCGKIDWLEYLPETDSVHIIDFKTGKSREDEGSLQLPIYHLLVHNCQNRKTEKASYWYLEEGPALTEKTLPDLQEAHAQVLEIAQKVKLARQLELFKCPNENDGCFSCRPYEMVVDGKAEHVGVGEFGEDIFVVERLDEQEKESVLL